MEPPSITLREGEEGRFDCSARSHIEVESIEWTREGDRLPEGLPSLIVAHRFSLSAVACFAARVSK